MGLKPAVPICSELRLRLGIECLLPYSLTVVSRQQGHESVNADAVNHLANPADPSDVLASLRYSVLIACNDTPSRYVLLTCGSEELHEV
jgi:hypothetical protein